MVVQISCKDNKLQIGFYDMGTPVDPGKVKHREIDNVKPLLFFIFSSLLIN